MDAASAWATGRSAVRPPHLRSSLRNSKRIFSFNFPARYSLERNRSSKLFCYCSSDNHQSNNSGFHSSTCSFSSSSSDWDWNRWTRHFSEIEQADSYASVLKFQLEDAIEKEDFMEASKLKLAIAEATSKDNIANITFQLKNAIDEERYRDALRLCQSTGSGLVGWWVGYSTDSDDPFGRLVQITPGTGRFIGRSYSPRQLITSSPGLPLFEIYVVKDSNETYTMQVVFLKQIKKNSANSIALSVKPTKIPPVSEIENSSLVDVKVEENEAENNKGESIDLDGATEEGIKSVIGFLKEKIPELKVEVMKVNITEDITEDSNEQLTKDNIDNVTSEDNKGKAIGIEDNQPNQATADGDSDLIEDDQNLDMKFYIGGVLHNKEDTPTRDEFIRVPADIKDLKKDSFVLHIPKRDQDQDTEDDVASNIKVAVIAAQAQSVSDLMPPDVAKSFWNSEKISSKISKGVREIVKHAVNQAHTRSRLSEFTNFCRISTSQGDLDPFDGLYVGAFGPHGTEVVQLRRRYGNWNMSYDYKSSEAEFFEYVEAVKLTGDLNVPAGQVTFRAKIGKGKRLATRGMYPDELGVVANYKGQGRIAEFGFRNPKWVEGELLQLNGKGMGPYVKGADLGFLYVVPEQSFLVLFNRLKLPE